MIIVYMMIYDNDILQIALGSNLFIEQVVRTAGCVDVLLKCQYCRANIQVSLSLSLSLSLFLARSLSLSLSHQLSLANACSYGSSCRRRCQRRQVSCHMLSCPFFYTIFVTLCCSPARPGTTYRRASRTFIWCPLCRTEYVHSVLSATWLFATAAFAPHVRTFVALHSCCHAKLH